KDLENNDTDHVYKKKRNDLIDEFEKNLKDLDDEQTREIISSAREIGDTSGEMIHDIMRTRPITNSQRDIRLTLGVITDLRNIDSSSESRLMEGYQHMNPQEKALVAEATVADIANKRKAERLKYKFKESAWSGGITLEVGEKGVEFVEELTRKRTQEYTEGRTYDASRAIRKMHEKNIARRLSGGSIGGESDLDIIENEASASSGSRPSSRGSRRSAESRRSSRRTRSSSTTANISDVATDFSSFYRRQNSKTSSGSMSFPDQAYQLERGIEYSIFDFETKGYSIDELNGLARDYAKRRKLSVPDDETLVRVLYDRRKRITAADMQRYESANSAKNKIEEVLSVDLEDFNPKYSEKLSLKAYDDSGLRFASGKSKRDIGIAPKVIKKALDSRGKHEFLSKLQNSIENEDGDLDFIGKACRREGKEASQRLSDLKEIVKKHIQQNERTINEEAKIFEEAYKRERTNQVNYFIELKKKALAVVKEQRLARHAAPEELSKLIYENDAMIGLMHDRKAQLQREMESIKQDLTIIHDRLRQSRELAEKEKQNLKDKVLQAQQELSDLKREKEARLESIDNIRTKIRLMSDSRSEAKDYAPDKVSPKLTAEINWAAEKQEQIDAAQLHLDELLDQQRRHREMSSFIYKDREMNLKQSSRLTDAMLDISKTIKEIEYQIKQRMH
ncbi:MAG: hypothetical protein JAY72_07075, partial [Candidatus Thiodiazotropha endolucinida]|nr:hypothetical protein [Candidatus Thiodiazotropha taylori]MCW4321424.1 hypothetical protein [Candidatus Thiodiazotropha taylori]